MNSSRLFMAEQLYAKYKTDYEAVFGPMPALGDATQFPPLSATLTGCQPMKAPAIIIKSASPRPSASLPSPFVNT